MANVCQKLLDTSFIGPRAVFMQSIPQFIAYVVVTLLKSTSIIYFLERVSEREILLVGLVFESVVRVGFVSQFVTSPVLELANDAVDT